MEWKSLAVAAFWRHCTCWLSHCPLAPSLIFSSPPSVRKSPSCQFSPEHFLDVSLSLHLCAFWFVQASSFFIWTHTLCSQWAFLSWCYKCLLYNMGRKVFLNGQSGCGTVLPKAQPSNHFSSACKALRSMACLFLNPRFHMVFIFQ